jgi:hypothetical protein
MQIIPHAVIPTCIVIATGLVGSNYSYAEVAGATVVVQSTLVEIDYARIIQDKVFSGSGSSSTGGGSAGTSSGPSVDSSDDSSNDPYEEEDDGFICVNIVTTRVPTPPNEVWDTQSINYTMALAGVVASMGAGFWDCFLKGIGYSTTALFDWYRANLHWMYTARKIAVYRDERGHQFVRLIWEEEVNNIIKQVIKVTRGSSVYYLTLIDNTDLLRWW